MQKVKVNGIEMAYLSQGQGPIVLLLHGFPDNADTWSAQMECFAGSGYRAVAPYLRGYPPSEVPIDGYFDKATLVADIAAFIKTIGGGEPVHFVGQDWGAIVGYGLCAAYPELINRAVLMAVPHPKEVSKSLVDPKHVQRSFHWWFFQQADLPEQAILANNMAFIDYLWTYWCAQGYKDDVHIGNIKNMLSAPGVLGATLGYYRAMFDVSKADPRLSELRANMDRNICVPTMALCGEEDQRAELMRNQEKYFAGEYQYGEIPKAGHFLHREQPTLVNRALLQWFEKQREPTHSK